MGDARRALRVLDAGGGSGELALWFLQEGYRIWLLHYAPGMLDQARRWTRTLPEEACERLSLCEMAVEEVRRAFAGGFFHLIMCHMVIEYLPDPRAALRELVALLGSGGVLSVTFVKLFLVQEGHADPVSDVHELRLGR